MKPRSSPARYSGHGQIRDPPFRPRWSHALQSMALTLRRLPSAVEGHSPWDRDTRRPATGSGCRCSITSIRASTSCEADRGEGITALAFIPVIVGDRLTGQVHALLPQPHEFTEPRNALRTDDRLAGRLRPGPAAHREEQRASGRRVPFGDYWLTQIDADAHFIMVNDHFCDLVGRTREELLKLDSYSVSAIQTIVRIDADLYPGPGRAPPTSFSKSAIYGPTVARYGCTTTSRDQRSLRTLSKAPSPIVLDITERKGPKTALFATANAATASLSRPRPRRLHHRCRRPHHLYNEAARVLWGRSPRIGEDVWCGSWKIYELDGITEMPSTSAPWRDPEDERPVRGVEIIVERARWHPVPHPALPDADPR